MRGRVGDARLVLGRRLRVQRAAELPERLRDMQHKQWNVCELQGRLSPTRGHVRGNVSFWVRGAPVRDMLRLPWNVPVVQRAER
jgi:hypothetical protein